MTLTLSEDERQASEDIAAAKERERSERKKRGEPGKQAEKSEGGGWSETPPEDVTMGEGVQRKITESGRHKKVKTDVRLIVRFERRG